MDHLIHAFQCGLAGVAGKQVLFQARCSTLGKPAKDVLLPLILGRMGEKAYP
jgi:hypothetical protein